MAEGRVGHRNNSRSFGRARVFFDLRERAWLSMTCCLLVREEFALSLTRPARAFNFCDWALPLHVLVSSSTEKRAPTIALAVVPEKEE